MTILTYGLGLSGGGSSSPTLIVYKADIRLVTQDTKLVISDNINTIVSTDEPCDIQVSDNNENIDVIT